MPSTHDTDIVKADDKASSLFRRRLFILVGIAVLCTAVWVVIAVVLTRDSRRSGAAATSSSQPASASSPRGEITPPAPGPAAGGFTDDVLRGQVWDTIISFYSNVRDCGEVSSQEISVAVPRDAAGSWVEAWTITACGETQVLHIQFTTDSEGGVRYDISE